ncbi:MliC family protein [Shewanella donghaensis]|uniref:MliC family protein n=1 Tax=Shewanella donghaensis TaxID=238836 RepID=UPI0011837803|nr:MliC family protein [Shewanella donghaensis]
MRRSLLIFLPFLLFNSSITSAAIQAPSFNCKLAQGQIEELICQNNQLTILDIQLNDVYQQLANKVEAAEFAQIKPIQRGWIKGRNDCWKAEDMTACVTAAYSSRITELQIAAGVFEVPAAIQYQCGVAENNTLTKITAYFYNDTATPAAVFTISPSNDYLKSTNIALLSRTASGAKYQGQNFSLWTHQNEATLSQFDQADLNCSVRPELEK